ncbi:hypothetical protein [Microbacterium sp. MYb62]|uniref:hypothetical protein n=1 Tax=Microbacterium sp. MYb62 TaxID=1848690 RepID=UPI000CFC4379|nr:hypothetical protein [Microbacterium sp. MYb62]PRB15975.1 hypothetical protein CQ042_07605 [Microbacterium sp. MYb62]
MADIEVHSEAYAAARSALTEAAAKLASARNSVSSAVPGMAFGPIGAFIPPVLNSVGAVVEGAAGFVGTVSQRTASGVEKAVEGFRTVDDDGRADLERIAAEG